MQKVTIRAKAEALSAALDDLIGYSSAGHLELDGHTLSAELRQLLFDPVLDATKLIRVDGNLPAGGAGDVLVSLQPSDLFLELLAALRARNVDSNVVQAESHGRSLSD